MATGILTIDSLLAVENQSAAEFGLDTIAQVLQADLDAHNAIVADMMGELCELSPDRQRLYGASQEGDMDEVDEFGRARSQQVTPGSQVGFPLRKFTRALGWTSTWFKVHTPADMARAVQGIEKAHLKRLQNEIKVAVFRASNYTYNDHLIDKFTLAIKRFVNADGYSIPEGPNGEQFDPNTHTHYDASASLTNAALLALIDDIVEHGHGGMVKLCINRGNETAVRGLADFIPYPDPRLVLGTHLNQHGTRLDISRLDNRAIGTFGAAEVWVKSWTPQHYTFCYDAEAEGKSLVFRQRPQTALQGLRIASENDDYPLFAQFMEAEFGIGVWTRTNGAVLFSNGGAYVDPF